MFGKVVIALVLVPSLAAAGEPWIDAPFTAPPRAVLQAAEAVKAPEGADELALLEEEVVVIDAEGRRSFRHRSVVRLLSDAAVHEDGSLAATWEPWYQDRPEIRARVIRPDGSVHALDPGAVEESGPRPELDMYSDQRRLRAPLPALAVGAVVEREVVVRDRSPPFAGGWVDRFYVGGLVPTRLSRLVIEAPPSLALRWTAKLLPGVKPQKSAAGKNVRLTFEAGPLPAIKLPETAGPVGERFPYVAFSTGRSWQDVATRYARIVDAQIAAADAAELAREAREATGGATDRDAVIARVVEWVRRKVRYTGVELGQGSIVPRTPAETLRQLYGDCKDQASLVVALLRASGVPAEVALLRTRASSTVDRELPGLGAFNHAIVFVPGARPWWIDPTHRWARVGELPFWDQGVLSLIADSSSTTLVPTPEAPYTANRSVETREFRLSENGAARVVETTRTFGSHERVERQKWSHVEPAKVRESLTEYVKEEYRAASLVKWEHSPSEDFSQPAQLTIEAEQAARGITDDDKATVAIFVQALARKLPAPLLEPDERKRKRSEDYLLGEPFVYELSYRIVPPPGFAARPLPADATVAFGPARIVQRYTVEPDGAVAADLRLEMLKGRVSPAEIEAIYDGYQKLGTQPISIEFESRAHALLAAGKPREGLEELRRLCALHPKEAHHHNQLALALVKAGLGEAARAESRRAVALEPNDALAWRVLGIVLGYDLIGRSMRRGFDPVGAEAAYRKALALDPTDILSRANLAVLLEHDADGVRYGRRARMGDAITEYRALQRGTRWDENIFWPLFYAHRFKELKDEAAARPSTPTRDQMWIAAIAATDGPAPAARRAAETIPDEERRRAALLAVAQLLLRVRLYSPARALFDEAARGAPNGAALRTTSENLRNVRIVEEADLRLDDPTGPAKRFARLLVVGDLADGAAFEGLLARDALDESARKMAADLAFQHRRLASALPLPTEAIADLALSIAELSKEGDDTNGWRVRLGYPPQFPAPATWLFVVREEGRYKLLAVAEDLPRLGAQALKRAQAGDLAGARRWLDWASEPAADPSDDPLGRSPFARVWPRAGGDRAAIELGAAVLMARGPQAAHALALITAARAAARTDDDRLACDLASTMAYATLNRWPELAQVAERLEAAYPTSQIAFSMHGMALTHLHRPAELVRSAEARLKLRPDDAYAQRALAELAADRGDWARSDQLLRGLTDSGRASAGDYNNKAWFQVMAGKAGDAIEDARRAVSLSRREHRAALHTLAVAQAELGRTDEALETLREAVDLTPSNQPLAEDYLVLGRVAEEYGLVDVAQASYQRVTFDKDHPSASSPYALAQRHLAKKAP